MVGKQIYALSPGQSMYFLCNHWAAIPELVSLGNNKDTETELFWTKIGYKGNGPKPI